MAAGRGTHFRACNLCEAICGIAVEVEDGRDIRPGVVSLPHGWGHDRAGVRLRVARERPGVSLNDLTDDQAVDALSGNAAFSGLPVEVTAAPWR